MEKKLFKNTNVNITNCDKRYLVSVIGTVTFKKKYPKEIISQLISEIEVLSHIAKIESQATYCCFIIGFKHNVTYLMSRAPNVHKELRRLDDTINSKLKASFRDITICENDEQHLLSLLTKLGGIGIPAFSKITIMKLQNLSLLTKEHVSLTARQQKKDTEFKVTINSIKKKIKREKQEYNQRKIVNTRG